LISQDMRAAREIVSTARKADEDTDREILVLVMIGIQIRNEKSPVFPRGFRLLTNPVFSRRRGFVFVDWVQAW